MSKIKDVIAREVLDSRGNPTIETEIILTSGARGIAIVPSGASTGSKEALELRDKDEKRYHGQGVLKAIDNIHHHIAPRIIGKEAIQKSIDQIMIDLDGTSNKSLLGANAILSVSMALLKALADEAGCELFEYLHRDHQYVLPIPMMNVINGGRHANSSVDFQEYMIVPVGASSFQEAVRWGSEVFHALKEILKQNHQITAVGDEGGFAPDLANNKEPLDYLVLAIHRAGYRLKDDIAIALDVAASEFYDEEQNLYLLSKSGEGAKTTTEMIDYLEMLVKQYPIISIEDGLSENDYQGWVEMTRRLGDRIQLVGDDLFVTNPRFLKEGIKKKMGNAILIKPNQIGTITETIETIIVAKKAGFKTIMSHRSGESEDTIIADLAVGFSTGQIKTGSLSRSERVAKYNRLMKIELLTNHESIYGHD